MKTRAIGVVLLSLTIAGSALAASFDVGDRMPREYRGDRFAFDAWRDAHLRRPPRGGHWALVDGQYYLLAENGTVVDVVEAEAPPPPPRQYGYAPPPGPPPGSEDRWRARYSRSYNLADDRAYSECRNKVDPAGVFAGAILGGILGNAAGGRRDSGGATVAGVVAGGAIGAALTSKMDCGDRSYAYKTYSDGFNAGRANATYTWRNPDNNNNGEMRVLDYYRDEDNFRCAVFSNTVYIGGRREEARGRACQQPNGTWAIID